MAGRRSAVGTELPQAASKRASRVTTRPQKTRPWFARAAQGVYAMTSPRRMTRRAAVRLAAAATALPLVHIRSAGAAGKLNVGFWDHWVPGGEADPPVLPMTWEKINDLVCLRERP